MYYIAGYLCDGECVCVSIAAYNIDIADFDGGYSRLFMKELNMHNGGTYECVAQNRLGEVQMKTEVLIVGQFDVGLLHVYWSQYVSKSTNFRMWSSS